MSAPDWLLSSAAGRQVYIAAETLARLVRFRTARREQMQGLIAHPAPACADPAGYWRQIFDRIQAAGDNARSASGIAGLVLAEAPLKSITRLERKLTAELRRTTGT